MSPCVGIGPVAVIAPFNLAWSSIQYSIARRPDATQQFTRVFRWFGPGLVLSGFGLAMAGQVVLGWLFPPAYGAARPVIPIVAAGWVFYGAYAMFATGVNVAGRSWLLAVYTTVAAAVNVVVNLLLIPPLGAVGAALATLIAYGALAAMAYAGTRLVHRIPFEVGRFLLAVLVGAAVYAGSDALAGPAGALWAWPLRVGALLACGGLLVGLGRRAGRAPSTTRRPAAVRAWWPARRPPS